MDECRMERMQLSGEFKNCQKAFAALGDETRQQIFVVLLEGDRIGMWVGEITKRTHLSRPAVSHHLQIMKQAGVISMHRAGTMNYYYVDANESEWGRIKALIDHVHVIVQRAAASGYPCLSPEE